MKRKSITLAVMAFFAMAVVTSQGAVSFITGTPYTQNFDSLNGVSVWTNDSTLAGWYAATTATTSITSIGSNTGTTTTGGLYSYGVAGTNAITDRSLGYATSNAFTGPSGSGVNLLGLQLTNSGASSLTSFTLNYDGEQWRRLDNTAIHTLTVQYSLDATSLATGTWTSAGLGLTFSSPQAAATALTLDGNAPANRTAGLTATVSSISWAAGTNLWIRWVDLNDSGNDHQLTIDNVTFNAVPEPSTALLGGLGLLALLRRRR